MKADGDKFSFSRMTTFEQCPRRYRYRYLDGVKDAFRSVEAFMGQQAHATIEWLYNERQAGTDRSAEEAVGQYCSVWDAGLSKGGAPVKVIRQGTAMESYRRMGAEMVTDFHRDRFASDDLVTVAMEKHFVVRLDGGTLFQGFIDRLARDDRGLLHIIDYKTGKRVPSRFEGKDADQLEAYGVAVFDEEEGDEIELALEYLRTGRRVDKRLRREQTPAIARRLEARVETAVAATVFPPSPGPLCDWCGYNDVCEASGEGRRAGRWAG